MDNLLFKRGDLVYAKNDTYDITGKSNSYIGLVLNDVYSSQDRLHLMNFYCSRTDTSYHLSLLSDETLTRALMMVRSNMHIYKPSGPLTPIDYIFRLKDTFPGLPLEDDVSSVWSYFVSPLHFNLLTPNRFSSYLNSCNFGYHSTRDSKEHIDFITHKLTRCFSPFSPLPSSSITL